MLLFKGEYIMNVEDKIIDIFELVFGQLVEQIYFELQVIKNQ